MKYDKSPPKDPQARAFVVVSCFLLLASAVLSLTGVTEATLEPRSSVLSVRSVAGSLAAERAKANSDDQKAAPAPQASGGKKTPARTAPVAPAATPVWDISPYRGLGAWVDLYDFGKPGQPAPSEVVGQLAERGVKTLYLQTGRWNIGAIIESIDYANSFIEEAHQHGVKVVAWYLPGFGPGGIDRDTERSLAVWTHRTPNGHAFDGFAPDIEDQREASGSFNLGIVEYSKRLRAALPAGTIIGAITPDAKNNDRAPKHWAGFPWAEIGHFYDVILPMTYWSVTKKGDCRAQDVDSAGYLREALTKTFAQMGKTLPVHAIGGIADCITEAEVARLVQNAIDDKWIGVSLYDFATTQSHPLKDTIWGHLGRGNELIPANPPQSKGVR